MEIPYIVTPRKDTGLFNAKIAIWLFLASEVMLFGGFFSAYVFLRLGADFPWPERTLPVLPGLINTFVLIASSVTVVFAWASLKLRHWGRFQIFMGITVACAGVFMVLKAIEYNVKFHHQALRMTDYSVVEGHLGVEKEADGKDALDHNGKKIEENRVVVEASHLTFSLARAYKPWVEDLLAQAKHNQSKITLEKDLEQKIGLTDKKTLAKAGEELSVSLLNRLEEVRKDARQHNDGYRTEALREAWVKAHAANPGQSDWKIASNVNIDLNALAPNLVEEITSVTFKVDRPSKFNFDPRDIHEEVSPPRLKDDTVVDGTFLAEESAMVFHKVDAIDFRHLVMKAKERQIDPEVAIENSWLLKNNPEIREIWEKQQKALGQLTEALKADDRVPTDKDKYRINWQEMVYYCTTKLEDVKIEPGKYAMPGADIHFKEQFFGPNYEGRGEGAFPELTVPRELVGHATKFTPAWNNYYAIYFTITGLHGLHVIGGALVLAYYLLFGRKMYLTNPEWLANRVEIGGLFWHFVDLVWIFVFPIMYLM